MSSQEEQYIYNPDLGKISTLMSEVWKRPCWEYTSDVLSSYILKPAGDPELSLGIFIGDQPAGYVCYVPYQAMVHGISLSILYATWWTANPRFPGRNIAMKLQRCLLQKTRNQGYAGIFTVTHHGSYADKANHLTFSRLHESFQLKKTFTQLIATPTRIMRRVQSDQSFQSVSYESRDHDLIESLLQKLQRKLDVCLDIPDKDMDYVFQDRPLTKTWIYRNGESSAFLNVVKKKFLTDNETTNAYLEKAYLDLLDEHQRNDFLSSVFADPFWKEIDAVCVPNSGMIDWKTLRSIGFAESKEQFNLYCIPFDDRLTDVDVKTFGLDIF